MRKVTIKEFAALAGCSEQLISVYVAKGMPKHPHPDNKKKNLYDLEECSIFAKDRRYYSFWRKINTAIKSLAVDEISIAILGETSFNDIIKSDNGMPYKEALKCVTTPMPEDIKSDNGKSFPGGLEEIMAMLNTINRKLDGEVRRKRSWKHYSRAWKRI